MSAPRSLIRSRPVRIALSGYYGFLNEGDEAVLRGLIQAFYTVSRNTGVDVELTALSINPAWTTADHVIRSAHRYRIGPLLRTLSWCDLLASGGGSLLQDVTSRHSIYYYLGVIRAAQIMGKRTMFIAQGVGPLNLRRSQRLTAAVARRCDAIAVRDVASAALLNEIGVPENLISVTADPALLLAAGSHSERRIKAPRPPSLQFLATQLVQSESITLAMRPWGDETRRLVDTVGSAVKAAGLAGQIGAIFPCSPDDVAISNDIRAVLNLNNIPAAARPEPVVRRLPDGATEVYHSVQGVVRATQQAQMVVGMRLHSLILAAAGGVPSVALSYDPKVAAFMEQSGQADAVVDLRDTDSNRLAQLMSQIWIQRHDRAELIRFLLPSLRASAQRNAEIALNLLPG